jgi:putative endonuclease
VGSNEAAARQDRRRVALDFGARAEERVAEELRASGVEIVARNWHGGGGELDLVVVRDGRLRFVEVKARHDDELDPLESIGRSKQRRLIGAARAWLEAHQPAIEEVCFLVAVVDPRTEPWSIAWLDNAFDGRD